MIKLKTQSLLSIVFLSLFALTACNQAEDPEPVAKPAVEQPRAESWEKFVTRQIEEHIEAHPQWAVVQGRHEYDGQLPDWSRAAIEREAARLHRARQEAMAFAADQLSSEQLYQREYLLSRIDQDLFWIEKAEWPFRNPEYYFGWLSDSLDPSA